MAFSAEQHRVYQEKRRLERLAMARERLGGKCVRCGSVDDLQFDHIVPGSKTRKVSEATNWSLERFLAEVDKCQLLCNLCHRLKSVEFRELNGGSKLVTENVAFIRSSGLTHEVLADMFGVSKSTIYRIRSGKTWKEL